MATLFCGSTQVSFIGQPTWSESLSVGQSNATFQIKAGGGNTRPPDSGLLLLQSSNGGTRYYGGFYEGLTVEDKLNGNQIYTVRGLDFADVLLTLKPFTFESDGEQSLSDVIANLLVAGGAANADWPFNLVNVSLNITGTIEYKCDGITLREAFDEICAATNSFYFCDSGTWTDSGNPNQPLTTVYFYPNDFTGNLAPADITASDPNANCNQNRIFDLTYEVGGPGYGAVIVQGKNGVLAHAGTIINARPDSVETLVAANSTQRHFPLLSGPKTVTQVEVDAVNKTFAKMRADAPETYTDANGDPVDCLIDTTSDGTPTLKFPVGSEPAGVSGCTLTVTYSTEYAIAKASIDGRAATFGAALGVPFAVERQLLIRRDDLDTQADCQTVADAEALKLTPTPFQVRFTTKNNAWRAGQGFTFTDYPTGRTAQVVTRQVDKTLEKSDGVNDTIRAAVTASNVPIITADGQTIKAFRQSLKKQTVKLRI